MQDAKKGKKIVVWIIVLFFAMDIAVTAIISKLWADDGMMELVKYNISQSFVRLLFTAVLMFFLYKGHKRAKWITAILSLLNGIIFTIDLFFGFQLLWLIQAIFYLFAGITLIFSPSVKEFFKSSRGEIKVEEISNDDIGNNM